MMAKMVCKQLYITRAQERALKRMVRESGVTEAEVIRRALDSQSQVAPPQHPDAHAWEEERAFIQEWMAKGTVEGKRNWRREDLHER